MTFSTLKPSTNPMKRTAFKRATTGLTGALSSKSRQMAKRVQRKVAKAPLRKFSRKAMPAHELVYLKRVAALPCVCCGIWGYSQAAHSNRYQDGKGRGIKADYRATFPLCCARPGEIGCHTKHDQCIGMTREEADERTVRYIADTISKLAASEA